MIVEAQWADALDADVNALLARGLQRLLAIAIRSYEGLLDEHGLPLIIVVFRDDTLSLIKLKQERMKLPETGVATGSPNYALLAKAYGGSGVVVQSARELTRAIQAALRSPRFTLIDARIDPAEYRRQM